MLPVTVQNKVRQVLNQSTGLNDWQFSDFILHTRESTFYRVQHPKYGHPIGIKQYHKKGSVGSRYQSMQYYHDRMNGKSEKYRVPIVYGYLEDDNLTMMEWVSAPTLRRQLWKNFYKKNTQQAYLKHSLQWLKRFHQQTALGYKPADAKRHVNMLESLLPAYQGYGRQLQNNNINFRAAMDCMRLKAEELQGFNVPQAHTHNDFSLANVLADKDEVVGIDFWAKQELSVAEDITQLLTTVAMTYPNMITVGDMKSAQSYDQWPLVKLFLDTYQYPAEPQQRQFFLYVFLHKLVHHWIWKGATTNGLVPDYGKKHKKSMKRNLQNRWTLFKLEQMTNGVTRALLRHSNPT